VGLSEAISRQDAFVSVTRLRVMVGNLLVDENGESVVEMLNLKSQGWNIFYLTTVEPPVATTSRKRPVFQNTRSFQVKSLYLEPLVGDHFS